MVVREEDLLELDEADVAAQELTLCALRAVEQEPLAAAPNERRAERALGRRHGARRPEKDDVEVHGGRLYSGAQCRPCASRYSSHAANAGVPLVRSRASSDAAPDVPRRVGGHPRGRVRSRSRRGSRATSRRPRLRTTHAMWPRTRTRCSRRASCAGTLSPSRRARCDASDARFGSRRTCAGSTSTPATGGSAFSTTRPDRIGRRRTSPDLKTVVRTNRPERRARRSDGQSSAGGQGVGSAAQRARSSRRRRRGLARRRRRHRDDGGVEADDLVRGRDRLRCPLARPRAHRARRVRVDASTERGPRRTLARRRRVDARARSHAARDDRDAQCRSRGARPVHGRPLAAGPTRLARHRPRAPAPGEAARRARDGCALPRHREDRDAGLDPHEARPTRSRRAAASCASTRCAVRRSSSRISSLSDCVPAIRHHHERWDGLGYPDGLSGDGHPGRGRDHRDRRRLGRDDDRPSLRRRTRPERGDAADPRRTREAVQPGGRRRVRGGRTPSTGGDPPARRADGCGQPSSRRSGRRDRCRPSRRGTSSRPGPTERRSRCATRAARPSARARASGSRASP